MRSSIRVFVVVTWLVLLPVFAGAAESKTIKGTVTGPDGKPVENAAISVYIAEIDTALQSFEIQPVTQTTTCSSGNFTVSLEDRQIMGYALFYAEQPGLAVGFGMLMDSRTNEVSLKLTAPKSLSGRVEDARGNPVADADVRLPLVSIPGDEMTMALGMEPVPFFAVRTDVQGRFAFTNLPEDATAEIMAKKPGLAPFHTLTEEMDPQRGCTFTAGQEEDIVLTLPDSRKITGIVTGPENQPVGNVKIAIRETAIQVNLIYPPVQAAEDGTFTFDGLAPGTYSLLVADPDWIAESVTVDVQADVGVQLKVGKGVPLTVTVVDGITNKPVHPAQVHIYRQGEGSAIPVAAAADNGTVQKQVAPGTYNVSAYAQGYRSSRSVVAVVEDGKPAEITITLGASAKVTGTVRDPDGNQIAGVQVFTLPSSGSPQKTSPLTDDKGQFAIGWEPQENNWTQGEYFIAAIHKEKNLAVAETIDAETQEVQLRLMPAETITGKVVDPDGKPLAAAHVVVQFRGSSWSTTFPGTSAVTTDDSGVYTVTALPPEQRYAVSVSGPKGFGTGWTDIEALDDGLQVTVPDIALKLANLSVSGKVVDVDDKPVEGVRIQCYGTGQPSDNTLTDKDGNFTFNAVCEGRLTLHAYQQKGGQYLYANVNTEGGAKDITVVLAPQSSSGRNVSRKPASLVGRPLSDLSAFGVELAAEPNRVLVCVWEWRQRPSRHFVRELTALKEMLSTQEIQVVLLNADPTDRAPLDAWLKEYSIPFTACGVIDKDADKARFALGVQALPWLILTDADRKVIAEGFPLSELTEKLQNSK
jgi:protocatechuate 3,4-dioxygenase beta subunit